MYPRTVVSVFFNQGHNSFLNNVSVTFSDKKNPSDPPKFKKFWREKLMVMAIYGVNIEHRPEIDYIASIKVHY